MLHRLYFSNDLPTVDQVEEIRFSDLPFREGSALERDLEELIANNVNLIEQDEEETMLVIGRQIRTGTGRVMDLVAIDNTGALTLIEVKRDMHDVRSRVDHAEIQSVRYAASLAALRTTDELVIHLFAPYIRKFVDTSKVDMGSRTPEEWARKKLTDFLNNNQVPSNRVNHTQNIVLIGGSFDEDTKSAAAWMAANELPIRVIEVRPCQVGSEYCLDVQQVIPVPEYQDFYTDINRQPRSKSLSKSGPVGARRKRLGRADLFEAGYLRRGDEIFVSLDPEKRATVLDRKYCEFDGEKLTYLQWARQITGWSSVNIFQVMVLVSTGETFGTLRERLESEILEGREDTLVETDVGESGTYAMDSVRTVEIGGADE